MDYQVSYEHSPSNDPETFIAQVPSQRVEGVPANLPRDPGPDYITELILQRSPGIGRIHNLRII